jgi:hypothetical protein
LVVVEPVADVEVLKVFTVGHGELLVRRIRCVS